MLKFTYDITRDFAMHLGPASKLASLAQIYNDTEATIEMGTRRENISKPLKVLTMGIRKGDRITITCEGPSEVELNDVLYTYFEDYM